MRNMRSSVRRTTDEYLSLCLIGFGSIERRDALMRVVQWALEPLLLYSSFVKDVATQEFEAVMITKKQVSASAVEEWLGLFNMGLCCIQFDAYMQADMVTCISRIHHMGKHWFGSFKAKPAARVRRDFYKGHMKEIRAKELERVLAVTGLTVTPGNMLAMHDRISGLQRHVSYLMGQLDAIRTTGPAEYYEYTDPHIVLDVEQDRENLASAYRRLQARGELPVAARMRPSPPTHVFELPRTYDLTSSPPPPPPADMPQLPTTHDLTSAPESPIPSAPLSPVPTIWRSESVLLESPRPPAVHSQAALVRPHGVAFLARPPPTGLVTVYVVRNEPVH